MNINFFKHLVAIVILAGCFGCGSYGEVSTEAYNYAKALYSVSNRRAVEQLPELAKQISESQVDGKLSSREAAWLEDILEDAEAGKWEAANDACRRLMEDQIER